MKHNDIDAALAALDIPCTDDNRHQMEVFYRAMCLYVERERERGGLWKTAQDAHEHLRSKALRVEHSVHHCEVLPPAIDDAIDACNYAAFFVRTSEGNDK